MATAEEKLKFLNNSKDDTILLFTNGRGEPKAINVDRCIEELGGSANPIQIWQNSPLSQIQTASATGLDIQTVNDFVSACPRVPLIPISFEFFNDPSKSSKNFEYVDGIQFSYQVVYKNGSTSAIAPYSDVAYPPQIASLGTKRISEVSVDNACRLFIPFVGLEARSIRIIAREGNDGQPRVVDDLFVGFDTSISSFQNESINFSAEYIFYNDKVGTILSEIDSQKNFDNVPRDASAQSVADNRVMYGNYTEGYPNIITDANLTVEFDEAPPPGFTFDLKVEPYLFIKPSEKIDKVLNNDLGNSAKRYKTNTGFIVDTTDFPETIPSGRYTVSVSVSPKNNYHIYLGRGDEAIVRRSYGATANVDDGATEGDPDIVGYPGSTGGAQGLYNSAKTRQIGLYGEGATGFVNTPGMACSYMDGYLDADSGNFWQSSEGGLIDYGDVGGSYSSPLIVKGETIELETIINVDVPIGRDAFSQSIVHGLCALNPNSNPIVGFGVQESPNFSVEEHFKEYDIDLSSEIYQGSSFDADSDLADLITSWSRHREDFSTFGNQPFDEATQHPEGFFVLTNGTVRFVFEPALAYAGNDPSDTFKYDLDDTQGYGVIMSFAHIENARCKTVIPVPEYNWGAASSPEAANATLNNIIGQGLFPGDPVSETRAARYQAMGSSQWSVRYEQGEPRLTWPGCVRQWETPDQTLNGPACLQHSNPQQPCYGQTENGFNLSGSVQPQSNFGPGQIAPNISPGDRRYHPAPIGRWICLGGASDEVKPDELDSSFFEGLTQSGNLFKVAFDVPSSASQSPSDYIRVGSPSEMLGPISRHYQGYVFGENRLENGRDIFRIGRDIGYELPDPTQTIISYKERGTLSVIDGNGGVGGARDYGANSFGDREDDSIWGNPLYSGYHSLSNFQANGTGRMANSKGVVTNFALLGYKDNCANLLIQEVWSRNSQTMNALSFSFLDTISDSYYQTGWANSRAQRIKVQRGFSVGSPNYYVTPFGYQTLGSSFNGGDVTGSAFYATFSQQNLTSIEGTLIRSAAPSSTYYGPSVSVGSSGITSNTSRSGLTSFKTKANHEFGLVYFDERGRHGAVQTLDSVYVPGYDELDRPNAAKGGASVKIEIFHRPPSWAKHYKVVYAGNTSVREFTQYSAAQAFVPTQGPNKNRIYVSLNHLQGNEASYAESYGAISQDDGSKNIYRFSEGDRLRILMYGNASVASVLYTPDEFDFRVVDFVVLDPDQENHPFSDQGASTNPQLNGQFLVLEDNQYADGFSAQNVIDGNDLWGSRCIFEIYSPFSALSDDARTYYETNYGGNVIPSQQPFGSITHEFNTIIVDKGDVFFRAVPTNVQDIDSGSYVQIIPNVDSDDSNSNFVSYFLETEGLTDLYKSKSKNYGRTHFVDRFADEVKRPSTISFSEQTPLGSYDLRYFSFPQIGNFKDLPPATGGIDKMTFEGTHIMSFNNSKLYKIPVSRDALTVSGLADDAIVSSAKVLGTEVSIDFDGGSSGRPESVISINNDFFFFDALNERIVMIQGGKTPVVITDSQINSYFREEVKKWKERGAFKAPSGYDPTRSEFLFTLHDEGDSSKIFDVSGGDESAETKMITIAFDLKSKKFWKSRYTFSSPHYSKLNESLVSFHKDPFGTPSSNGNVIINPWLHEKNAAKNNFFGSPSRSNICIASNQDQSKVKEYDVIILDSDATWDAKLYTKDGFSSIAKSQWKRYNDKWYAPIPGTSPSFNEVGQEISKKGYSETTINTSPFSYTEIESIDGELNNVFYPGPKRFRRVKDSPTSQVEIEMKIQVPLTSSSYLSSLPIGKTSRLYESDPVGSKMLPLGLLGTNAHVFDRFAYIFSEEEGDGLTYSNLIVRMPEIFILNYCTNNGYQDVYNRLSSLPNDPEFEFILDESQNDQTGHRIFDIVFAPFYSMQFGVTAEQRQTLDNFIAEVEDGDLDFAPPEYDLNQDGFVDQTDIDLILDYLNTQNLDGDLNGDGQVTVGDLQLLQQNTGVAGNPFLNDLTVQTILSTYSATKKSIHSVYVKLLNTEPLTGRYMKIDLVSDADPNEDELFEVGVDFNTRVKSISNVSKKLPKGPAKKRFK